MTLWLDTHTLLWFLTNDSSLSARARGAIEDSANVAHVSAASLKRMALACFPLPPAHCATLLSLPFHHRAGSTPQNRLI